MTTELQMLALSALLTLGLALPPLVALIAKRGLAYAAGNRGEAVTLAPWGDRAARAHRNMLENLAPFAALVLAAQVAGVSNEATALGATLFFAGRVGHAVTYLLGVPYLRTVAFVVSIGGMLDIAFELLRAI